MTPTHPNPPPPTHFCIHWRCSDGSAPNRTHLPLGVDFDEACRTAREKAPRTARWIDVAEVAGRHGQLVVEHREWRSVGGGPFVPYLGSSVLRERARRKAEEVAALERALDTADLVRAALAAAGVAPAACEPDETTSESYVTWRSFRYEGHGWRGGRLMVELVIKPADPTCVEWSFCGEPLESERKYGGYTLPSRGETRVVDGAVALPTHVLDVIRCVVMGAACPALRVRVARQDP